MLTPCKEDDAEKGKTATTDTCHERERICVSSRAATSQVLSARVSIGCRVRDEQRLRPPPVADAGSRGWRRGRRLARRHLAAYNPSRRARHLTSSLFTLHYSLFTIHYSLTKQKHPIFRSSAFLCVGAYLSSRAATSQVLSAQVSLTAVFGMGTGVPSPPSAPTISGTGPVL